MYASSLGNLTDLEKYKDVFSQLAPADETKIEQGVVGQEIKNTMLNEGVPEVQAKFTKNMENYSKIFPKSAENAKMYATMTIPNFDSIKFQKMYNISGAELRRMLQNAKDKMIEDVKKEENIDIDNLGLQYGESINKTKNSDEKSKLERTLQGKINEIVDTFTKNKIAKINEDYQKKVEQVSS